MMTVFEKHYGNVLNLEQYTSDTRLTEPSNGKIYNYQQMQSVIKKLNRPLTIEEAEEYRIK